MQIVIILSCLENNDKEGVHTRSVQCSFPHPNTFDSQLVVSVGAPDVEAVQTGSDFFFISFLEAGHKINLVCH